MLTDTHTLLFVLHSGKFVLDVRREEQLVEATWHIVLLVCVYLVLRDVLDRGVDYLDEVRAHTW